LTLSRNRLQARRIAESQTRSAAAPTASPLPRWQLISGHFTLVGQIPFHITGGHLREKSTWKISLVELDGAHIQLAPQQIALSRPVSAHLCVSFVI
jgi:hypothetical protein